MTEPTDDWKVEQVLWWCLLRSQEENDGRYEMIVSSLHKQLSDGQTGIMGRTSASYRYS